MRFAAALLAIAILGQTAPAVAQVPPAGDIADGVPRRGGNPLLAGMSSTGRAIMRAASQEADPRSAKEATAAARDRMIAIIDADRFDPQALRRAMDDERESANTAKVRQQTAMLNGIAQLSFGDRRILAGNLRAMRQRVEERAMQNRFRPAGPGPYSGGPPQ